MTKITFYRRDGVFYGFREQGHTGYGESGEDVLCASISAMTMLLVNTVEVAYASDISYTISEDDTEIEVKALDALPEIGADEKKQYAVAGLFSGYYYQLMDLMEEYYEYLDVEIKDD
ncbi:MAG: ribosomal-processing cysteine protease Prp [Clostridia bacterium]|nr:ribosomal-processing cysteine protease Prp [Clostridia bacterium]